MEEGIQDASNPQIARSLSETGRSLELRGETKALSSGDYKSAYGEELSHTLDLNSWDSGDELVKLYERLEREIQEAVRQEDDTRAQIRKLVFPLLPGREGAPPDAGVYQSSIDQIERIQRGYLFNGAVEACDGNCIPHDTLSLTIVQIGIFLVSYRGDQGSWVHRLFRRDLRMSGGNPVEEALELLDNRRRRTGYDQESPRDRLASLGQRGIMAYAERAVLLKRATAPWRMGHGNPVPFELLTGSGIVELLAESLDVLEELILNHKRFVFVPSALSDRMLLTIGNALRPLEYAIVDTMTKQLSRIVDYGHYRGPWARIKPRLDGFVKEAGPKVVMGLYRASSMSPAQVFYAHTDHVHTAAHIVIADSALQEYRGFPMLITLADSACSALLGTGSLVPHIQVAYADAGAPFRYQTERQSRR